MKKNNSSSTHNKFDQLKNIPLKLDTKFVNYFRDLKQVFLYITDECNLNCLHCLYKANLVFKREMEPIVAARLLTTFKNLGANKLTLIGGEATLYSKNNNYKYLSKLVIHARDIGYKYIRLDTNGQFDLNIFNSNVMFDCDEISFSIDGFDSTSNDIIRGANSFGKAISRLRESIRRGINVHITSCVTRQNVDYSGSTEKYIDTMIKFAESENVSTINFHGVFKMGVPMDTWTEGCHISSEEWISAYNAIFSKLVKNEYNISVRLPMHFVKIDEFVKKPEYYGYCPCKLGERLLIHPNGIIRICSSLLCTPYSIAKYDKEQIYWEEIINELYRHDFMKPTPCTNQKALYTENIVPLCFSFKPRQIEPVWVEFHKEGINKSHAVSLQNDI